MPATNLPIGIANTLFKSEGIEALSNARIDICKGCAIVVESKSLGLRCDSKRKVAHADTGEKVSGCGCILRFKTRVKEEECPAGKWGAVFD